MQSEFLFVAKEPFKSCHAATICECPNGDLMAAWYAGSDEGAPDQVIVGTRLKHGSHAWTDPQIIVDVPYRAAGNPRLFFGPGNALWLITPVNYGLWCSGGTRLFYKRSYDYGVTWKDLEILVDEPGILGKNKPLRIDDGSWILPVEKEETWAACFLRSEDEGKTWSLVGDNVTSAGIRCIQPAIVQLASGELLAYMRTKEEGAIAETRSKDKGRTWSPAVATALPNNNSGLDLVRLNSGNLVLVLNKIKFEMILRPGLGWGLRTPLNLLLSTDEGQTWEHEIILENKPGEYSYPAVIQSAGGEVHAVYTYDRTKIKHVVVTEEEIMADSDSSGTD